MQDPHRPSSPRYRRASEIGGYLFCRRAWWLEQVRGEVSANTEARARGTADHAVLGRAVHRGARLHRLALLVGLIALILIVLGIAGGW